MWAISRQYQDTLLIPEVSKLYFHRWIKSTRQYSLHTSTLKQQTLHIRRLKTTKCRWKASNSSEMKVTEKKDTAGINTKQAETFIFTVFSQEKKDDW